MGAAGTADDLIPVVHDDIPSNFLRGLFGWFGGVGRPRHNRQPQGRRYRINVTERPSSSQSVLVARAFKACALEPGIILDMLIRSLQSLTPQASRMYIGFRF